MWVSFHFRLSWGLCEQVGWLPVPFLFVDRQRDRFEWIVAGGGDFVGPLPAMSIPNPNKGGLLSAC